MGQAKFCLRWAEWLRMLIFSTVNHSSSHHCGFEPACGGPGGRVVKNANWVTWYKPSSACSRPPG